MEGIDLFARKSKGREYVISAKDRMGNAIDHVRAVRTNDYLYVKNYLTDRPLYQPAYRDGYATFITLRKLYKENKLTPLQASYHEASQRPDEELYNVRKDPNQLFNLAGDPEFESILEDHRKILKEWEESTDDKGRYPYSREELEKVFNGAPEKCVNPEYDVLRK